jgi:N-acetylneuraminic acid mutarotase
MANKPDINRKGLSRREVLAGAAAAALAASVQAAGGRKQRAAPRTPPKQSAAPVLRYMAAAASLGDGRILITGGYDRPFTARTSPNALSSVVAYNPTTGEYANAAPMLVARARHSAVTLRDGRVAVIGGVGKNPTASIEVYDPSTDSWTVSSPLSQPRYDHVAVYDGNTVLVFGGSGQSMLSSVESVYPGGAIDF